MRVRRTFLAEVTQTYEIPDGQAASGLTYGSAGHVDDLTAADELVCATGRMIDATWRALDDWQLDIIVDLSDRDTASSASRQHFIDTGRYLAPGEGDAP